MTDDIVSTGKHYVLEVGKALRFSTMLFIINHLGVSKLVFYAWSEVRTLNPITQMKKEKGVGWWGVELHLLMLSCLLQFHFHWLKYTTVYLTLCPR